MKRNYIQTPKLWTFITPEACQTLELYKEKWKSDIGNYPKPDDPPSQGCEISYNRLNALEVRKRLLKIVKFSFFLLVHTLLNCSNNF